MNCPLFTGKSRHKSIDNKEKISKLPYNAQHSKYALHPPHQNLRVHLMLKILNTVQIHLRKKSAKP